jgi:hypothetical protein
MSYKKLEIWERARKVSIAIHKMTLTELPKFEMYETGSPRNKSLYTGSPCNLKFWIYLFRQLSTATKNKKPVTSDQKPITGSKTSAK